MLRKAVLACVYVFVPLFLSFAALASSDHPEAPGDNPLVLLNLSTLISVISVATAALTAGRVVFVLEDRARDLKERVTKLETFAEEFNGPARAKHVELVSRVNSLELSIAKLATTERVDHMMHVMQKGFDDIMEHLRRIERDRKDRE